MKLSSSNSTEPHPQNRLRSFLAVLVLGWLVTSPLLWAEADTSLEFPDGRVSEVILVRAGAGGISWRLPGATSAITTPYNKISAITFPAPDAWTEAMTDFDEGNFAEAAKKFERIAKARNAGNFYPAPGNYCTLAKRRLLDCYRELGDPYMVGVISRDFEYKLLNPSEKSSISSTIVAWAYCGNKQWDLFFPEAAKADKQSEPGSREAAEIAFLRGMAYKSKQHDDHSIRRSILEFSKVASVDGGGSRNLARRAIKEAADLMKDDPLREKELKALLHVYRSIIGDDALWENASPKWVAVTDAKVDQLGGSSSQSLAMERREITEAKLRKQRQELADSRNLDGMPEAVKLPATAPSAQRIRIELSGNRALALAELEVFSKGKNVALGATVRMSGGDKTSGNANDSVKDLAADTGAGEDPYIEIVLDSPALIDKIVLWTAPGQKEKLEGFRVKLMDSSGRASFQRDGFPAPLKSLEILCHQGAAG